MPPKVKNIKDHIITQIKLDSISGCWEWQGAHLSNGYSSIRYDKKHYLVHRLFWILTNGEIPKGLWLLHKCDNPNCINPEHLFLGTVADNQRDMSLKGRGRGRFSNMTHCMRGHRFTKKNTYIDNRGDRSCNYCREVRALKWRKENKFHAMEYHKQKRIAEMFGKKLCVSR